MDALGHQVADYYGELHKHRLSAKGEDLGTETWAEKNTARQDTRERSIKEIE